MVTPFLTLQRLSILLSKPSASFLRDTVASPSAVEQFLNSDEEEEGRAIAILAQEQPEIFKRVA